MGLHSSVLLQSALNNINSLCSNVFTKFCFYNNKRGYGLTAIAAIRGELVIVKRVIRCKNNIVRDLYEISTDEREF